MQHVFLNLNSLKASPECAQTPDQASLLLYEDLDTHTHDLRQTVVHGIYSERISLNRFTHDAAQLIKKHEIIREKRNKLDAKTQSDSAWLDSA
ncbi:hypothetical protein ACHAQI_011215 [Fusarium lateritium]